MPSKQLFYILEEDKRLAQKRIDELTQAIQDLGPEFNIALNQSNETWHDNAPFDELRDRQAVMVAELQQLKGILMQAHPSLPRHKKDKINLGDYVIIRNQQSRATQKLFIAGDWTPYAGQKKHSATVVSRTTPLAAGPLLVVALVIL
jgi:transcription elongation GreA/GreB family factor